jgi:hypothetical protein
MNVYWFEVQVAGPVTDDDSEALGQFLPAAGRIDATVRAGERGGTVMFSREADDAVQAVVSAIVDLGIHGRGQPAVVTVVAAVMVVRAI